VTAAPIALQGPGSLPRLGVGLSTDFYFPPLEELLAALQASSLRPDYIEIFRGKTEDLERARREIVPSDIPLSYHGDALWYTEPAFPHSPAYQRETCRANRHLDALGSPWIIHECARKTLAGRTFGYYLPPVLDPSVARVIRDNALLLQSRLRGRTLLIEIPPFPFFSMGSLSPGDFFRTILEGTSLGMGLDIGHAMTAFRIEQPFFVPQDFAGWIRDTFPLEHVVEIHAGGLSMSGEPLSPDFWDDHRVRIPDLLWECLEAVLVLCPFPALRGAALEVDNKDIPTVVEEFGRFRQIVDPAWPESRPDGRIALDRGRAMPSGEGQHCGIHVTETLDNLLLETLLEGRPVSPEITRGDPALYRNRIYAEEIWEFGGYLPDIFPRTIESVEKFLGNPRQDFVDFFHTIAFSEFDPYDYLRTKTFVTGLWVEDLIQRKKITGKAADHVLQTVREEITLLLYDQETVNGDPCPGESLREGCPVCKVRNRT
jgi:uncharacterized protein (UPF0276 family)